MPGCAITEVEIDGVEHEYSAIEGVQEDVIEILLNLKGVALSLNGKDSAQLTLSAQGPAQRASAVRSPCRSETRRHLSGSAGFR